MTQLAISPQRGVFLASLAAFALATVLSEVVAAEWIRQFGTSASETATGVASDGLGNAYIAVETDDGFLSKFDAMGALLWKQQFGTTDTDATKGVAVDGLGHVYVSGFTAGVFSGNVAKGGWDSYLTAYDTSGAPLWTRQLGTSADDFTSGISADKLGNVYVAGNTQGSLGGSNAGGGDAFLAKYDSLGNLAWTRQLGTSAFDASGGVSVDAAGNIYLAGYTGGDLGGPQAGSGNEFLAKYDDSGNLQWIRRFGSSSEIYGPSGVATDDHGNAYVSVDLGGNIPRLVKFSQDGNLLWLRSHYGSGANSTGVSVDDLGNVYVSGEKGAPDVSTLKSDVFVLKYSENGDLLGKREFGTPQTDFSSGVSADSLGNIFISGHTLGNLGGPNAGGYDPFIANVMEFIPIPEPASHELIVLGASFMLAAICRHRWPIRSRA